SLLPMLFIPWRGALRVLLSFPTRRSSDLIEHQLLSEAFFQLFIVSALVLLAWNRRPNLPAAAATGALIGLASLIRFVGLAAIVAALVYALVRRVGWVRVATILVAFLVPLAAYGLWFRSVNGSFG